ncbi:LEAF RUST 10 DISEASE-RESISTANCE LOCUS RECEPTOR-LIKE PROTEIN KINASE-like 1.2 isoform X4 [Triticum dicoccoides]|uniref:LEAF RUST 10 DISEASE-RESISTANCE LOCUS RECEPTOR-LIKE PROTEIN KINASE-like 1.2 isoform X4 n=1 Tax=Triticum dicoccoides TaxID=85692 RepID=UPI00188DE3EA|nr:LEAF RUST 10 DISEASE-RESISTANCE LOCUS RECEPTOR-LIKE PROTEIN KINASE-like 1.2 isoform X4 [Triticum dicoccoides]
MPALLLLLLLAVLLLFAAANGYPPTCGNATCGGLTIAYPFWLNSSSASNCGYRGLGLACEGNTTLILPAQSHHRYRVSGIDYDTHSVFLVDDVEAEALNTASCPHLHFNFTIDAGSALQLTQSDSNITFFYNCKRNASWPSAVELTGCPDYNGSSYAFAGDGYTDEASEYGCEAAVVAPVLDAHKKAMMEAPPAARYVEVLKGGFELNYSPHSEQCGACERSGGWCGYRHNQTHGGVGFACFCDGGPTADQCGSNKKKNVTIAGVVVGVGGALLVAAVMVFLFIRKRRQRKVVNSSSKLLKYRYSGSGGTPTRSRGGDMESGSSQDMGNRFSYEELEEATDSFNENRELGDGGFGTVYKGYLGDGRVVAVKRLYNNSYRRVEQFVNEAAILARLRHPNLVMFYGCTSKESRELLLVYEFVQNGTVADHLHGPRAAERALPWPLRLSIAVESAAALTYLHAIEPPIVHRDVKTNNILLDTDFHVKVADFGLSRLFPLDATHVSTAPQGTPGYVDPEYHQCYQLTDKSDVYSFGVVLVELISSKPAVDITRQRNEINLAGMAISKIQKCRLEELVDVELGYESDPAARKMMTMVAELAFRCLQQNGEMRPPIREVLDVLRAIQDDCLGHKDGGGKGKKDFAEPFSPNTVHAPWDSRNTTPNTSQ